MKKYEFLLLAFLSRNAIASALLRQQIASDLDLSNPDGWHRRVVPGSQPKSKAPKASKRPKESKRLLSKGPKGCSSSRMKKKKKTKGGMMMPKKGAKTCRPTSTPTVSPTRLPTLSPTSSPTSSPTFSPTTYASACFEIMCTADAVRYSGSVGSTIAQSNVTFTPVTGTCGGSSSALVITCDSGGEIRFSEYGPGICGDITMCTAVIDGTTYTGRRLRNCARGTRTCGGATVTQGLTPQNPICMHYQGGNHTIAGTGSTMAYAENHIHKGGPSDTIASNIVGMPCSDAIQVVERVSCTGNWDLTFGSNVYSRCASIGCQSRGSITNATASLGAFTLSTNETLQSLAFQNDTWLASPYPPYRIFQVNDCTVIPGVYGLAIPTDGPIDCNDSPSSSDIIPSKCEP